MPRLSRRDLIAMGVGSIAVSALGGCGLGAKHNSASSSSIPVITPPSAENDPLVERGSFVSAARGGVTTNWAIARPDGHEGPLRPAIALHWRTGDANKVMALGLRRQLTAAVANGSPPFAIASVDGGDTYWHARQSGSDSGRMVLDEFIPLLQSRGLDTSRIAFMGWSMGGYGALLLGARLGWPRTAAISVASPAVWTPGDKYPREAFDGDEDLIANSVWGLGALSNIPIRIDCGTEDPLYDHVRNYVAQLETPPAGAFSPGRHDDVFLEAQLPAELKWVAPLLTADP